MPRQDLLQFARLTYRVACRHLPPYGSKFSPKKFTQPSLLACLCLKEYLRLDYRGVEALARLIGGELPVEAIERLHGSEDSPE